MIPVITNDSRHGGTLVAAPRVAALKRVAPYLATLLVLMILLLVGYLRARGTEPSQTGAEVVVSSSTGNSAASAGSSRSADPTATPAPMDPAPPATATIMPAPTDTRSTTTHGKKGSQIVAWIRDLGLTGGGGSYQEAFLAELAWGRCGDLLRDVNSVPKGEVYESTRVLYRAAAQACLAAFHGERSLWPAADAAVEELSGRSAALDCIDRSVYDIARTLVMIHRSNPGAVLRRGRADDADGPDCPRLRSVEPVSGPAAGGYEVRITGEHLPNPAVIHFGDVTRTVPTSDGRTALFTVPPVGQDYNVSVWVEGWPYEVNHQTSFSYDPPTSGASTAAEESHGP